MSLVLFVCFIMTVSTEYLDGFPNAVVWVHPMKHLTPQAKTKTAALLATTKQPISEFHLDLRTKYIEIYITVLHFRLCFPVGYSKDPLVRSYPIFSLGFLNSTLFKTSN